MHDSIIKDVRHDDPEWGAPTPRPKRKKGFLWHRLAMLLIFPLFAALSGLKAASTTGLASEYWAAAVFFLGVAAVVVVYREFTRVPGRPRRF